MSWQAYEVLTFQPDFTKTPIYGIGESGRVDTSIGMRPMFSEWAGDTSLAFKFQYRTTSPVEHKELRQQLNRFKGKWGAFYVPSWRQDADLSSPAAIGDTSIVVTEAGFAEMVASRPDTEGRVIFALAIDGTLQTFYITTATNTGGGTETLELDRPLTSALTLGETMIGFCHLVRLADDTAEWECDAPGQASIELRMVTVQHRSTIDIQLGVTSQAIGNAKPYTEVLAEDIDPTIFNYREPIATGPFNYGLAQGTNYVTSWRAEFIAGPDVRLIETAGGIMTTSLLYDESNEATHLALCFDPLSREILAWARDRTTCRVRWYASGLPQTLDFIGFSPVAFNTWAIDGTVSAGDAEAIVYYLKPGYSAIFCRVFGESFATEYMVIQTPVPPLYLHEARRNNTTIEIVGMDASHRACRWISDGYTPPVMDAASATIEFDSSAYVRIIAAAPAQTDAAGSVVALDSGEYVSRLIYSATTEPGPVGSSVQIGGGEYVSHLIYADAGNDTQSAELVIDAGAYTIIARTGSVADENQSAVTIDPGLYEIP